MDFVGSHLGGGGKPVSLFQWVHGSHQQCSHFACRLLIVFEKPSDVQAEVFILCYIKVRSLKSAELSIPELQPVFAATSLCQEDDFKMVSE